MCRLECKHRLVPPTYIYGTHVQMCDMQQGHAEDSSEADNHSSEQNLQIFPYMTISGLLAFMLMM